MSAPPTPAESILKIPLRDVLFDEAWNARSRAAAVASGEDDEATGFEGLLLDLAERGQQDPIDVVALRPGASHKYAAVTGFRRGRALRMLAEGHDPRTGKDDGKRDPGATVSARVRALTPLEARVRNLAENTQRASLSAADIAYGIGEWWRLDPKTNALEIAHALGLTQGHVIQLSKVALDVAPAIFRRWRETPGCRVGLQTMVEISRLPSPAAQAEAFESALKCVGPRGGRRAGSGRGSSTGRAKELGTLFALLERAQIVAPFGLRADWSAVLDAAVRAGLVRLPPDREKAARAMAEAYLRAGRAETPKERE